LTVRSQAIVMSAGRQIRQASKQTIKNEQCGSNPPKGVPQADSHNTWALVSQGGNLWPIANWEQRYATQDVHNHDPGRDGRGGAGARRATVPDAGSWWPLPRIKGPLSTGREIWSLDFSQLGLKLPNTSLWTYPQILKSPIEVLVGYPQWPRSNLGPEHFPRSKELPQASRPL